MGDTGDLAIWESRFADMQDEQRALRAAGMWKSGRRTLLNALGIEHSETRLCDALKWALTPDGWHGAGVRPLRQFLLHIGLPSEELHNERLLEAQIEREEVRNFRQPDETRADIVIRLPGIPRTVLVEAKVFASEQPRQAERLANLWASEDQLLLVFLTRTGQLPATSAEGGPTWRPLAWSEVAQVLRSAGAGTASAGYEEFVETLEIFGGHRHG